jgi:GNAT superfamily N-acetyltransferase
MIFSKWLRSLRYGNDYFRLIDPDEYWKAYNAYIKSILMRGDTMVRIASLTEDADVALGFSVVRGAVLDYVHVHKDFRKKGIGRILVPKNIKVITHLTKTGLSIWGSKYPKWKFNPFA